MSTFVDQTSHRIELSAVPKKIISLVPSQTELLADLGLRESLVGITKYCIYPAEVFLSVKHVGGTKTFDIEKIKAIKPDLIIGNKEENPKEHIEALREHFPVWVSNISNLHDALESIYCIGELTATQEKAAGLITSISNDFKKLEDYKNKKHQPKKTLYMIWRKPYMAAGGDTFISDMLYRCGFDNVLYYQNRYPELDAKQIKALNPEVILLSSEPYPYQEKHVKEFQAICPQAKIMRVEGEYFSWYGSRLLSATNYFKQLQDKIFNHQD